MPDRMTCAVRQSIIKLQIFSARTLITKTVVNIFVNYPAYKMVKRTEHSGTHQYSIFSVSFEPRHEISNNVVCATSKGSDQPAQARSLITAFGSCLNIL